MASDWSHLGEEVKNIVQSAVDSQNFQELNRDLSKTLNEALDQVGKTVRDTIQKTAADMTDKGKSWEKTREEQQERYRTYTKDADRHMYDQAASRGSASWRQRGTAWEHGDWRREDRRTAAEDSQNHFRGENTQVAERMKLQRERFGQTGSMTGAGALLTAAGCTLAGVMGLGLLATLGVAAAASAVGGGLAVGIGALGLFTLGGGVMAAKGIGIMGRAKRFRRYRDRIGQREYCDLRELETAVGKPRKYVVKDLKRMIRSRLFKQGYLDEQNTCLMVTDHAYGQYQAAKQQLEQRQREQKRLDEERKKAPQTQESAPEERLNQEARKVIREGKEYLEQIRKSNDAIPGEEISNKISRLEVVVEKIFDRVERHPELIGDLRKFMNYYLPTTVKLLGAYAEMDAQPVQGPNIVKSKQEIEETLDTIREAFENLLDSFFKDTAWDISSDITVLETMLAQEGLTKGDFNIKEKESHE